MYHIVKDCLKKRGIPVCVINYIYNIVMREKFQHSLNEISKIECRKTYSEAHSEVMYEFKDCPAVMREYLKTRIRYTRKTKQEMDEILEEEKKIKAERESAFNEYFSNLFSIQQEKWITMMGR